MGQYHEIWAFNAEEPAAGRAQTIEHYAFGAGAKLGEQCYSFIPEGSELRVASPYCAAIGMLASHGQWLGKRLVVIGDYAETDDVPDFVGPVPGWGLPDYYSEGEVDTPREQIDNLTDEALKTLAEAAGYTFSGSGWKRVVVPDDIAVRAEKWHSAEAPVPHVLASSKGEYLRPEAFGSSANPLFMPFTGAVWPVAVAMLACSDGRGGGDTCFAPAGRWAFSVVTPVPADSVQQAGFVDVTDWVWAQERTGWIASDG